MVGRELHGAYPEDFAVLARSWAEAGGVRPTLEQVVARSVDVVPCGWAAVAVAERMGKRPPGLAATTDADVMATVARIAGSCGVSPGLTAFANGTKVYCPDLMEAPTWSQYALEMVAHTAIRSVLSFGLRLRDRPLGVLTFYSAEAGGFDEAAQRRGALLADHATIAIDAATFADRTDDLKAALASNRAIGAAMGVLAERHGIALDGAFDLLRLASCHANRKLADIADEFLRTGELADGGNVGELVHEPVADAVVEHPLAATP